MKWRRIAGNVSCHPSRVGGICCAMKHLALLLLLLLLL
jgi:hypothetical protein